MLNKMKSLIAQLKEADAAYYGKDNPIMTDLEYDRLYNELAQLEAGRTDAGAALCGRQAGPGHHPR